MPHNSDQQFPYEENRAIDKIARLVASYVPSAKMERTRDVYQFTQEDPEGFVVVLTPNAIEIRLPTVEWTEGYAGPADCSLQFKRKKIKHGKFSLKKLQALIQLVRDARRAETKCCHDCGTPTSPEHAHEIHGDWVCHGCAERFRGVCH